MMTLSIVLGRNNELAVAKSDNRVATTTQIHTFHHSAICGTTACIYKYNTIWAHVILQQNT